MRFKNRTAEFQSLVKSASASRAKSATESEQPSPFSSAKHKASFFTKEANIISKAIISTTMKLDELSKRNQNKKNQYKIFYILAHITSHF